MTRRDWLRGACGAPFVLRQPQRVTQLMAAYDAWAARCGVLPWNEVERLRRGQKRG